MYGGRLYKFLQPALRLYLKRGEKGQDERRKEGLSSGLTRELVLNRIGGVGILHGFNWRGHLEIMASKRGRRALAWTDRVSQTAAQHVEKTMIGAD